MSESEGPSDGGVDKPESGGRRKIKGNLPYISNYGSIKPVLDKIITAARPERLTQDYLANVFDLPGGGYKAALSILRRVGVVAPDGAPTEIYTKFRSEDERANAVYQILKSGFDELFKRSENVYAANDVKLTDLICQVTGLAKEDDIVRNIRGTFRAFSSYLPQGFSSGEIGVRRGAAVEGVEVDEAKDLPKVDRAHEIGDRPLGLSYHINIVLPESKDVDVFNTIFKSLRENLLR